MLIGENGADKGILMKILAGADRAEAFDCEDIAPKPRQDQTKLSSSYCSGLTNAAKRHLSRKKYLPLSNF